MALPKKGSRKIEVDGIIYRWRVSPYKRISEFRDQPEILSEEYIKIAGQYGLGKVADIVFTVVAELAENPVSKIVLKYEALCVDGFLGPEQLVQIKPALIADLIKRSCTNGWVPNRKGDFHLQLYETSGEKHRPALLVLQGFKSDGLSNYSNYVFPIRIV